MSAAMPQPGFSIAQLLWFRHPDDVSPYINETAVRIRAGIMLAIPVFMAFTLVAFQHRYKFNNCQSTCIECNRK